MLFRSYGHGGAAVPGMVGKLAETLQADIDTALQEQAAAAPKPRTVSRIDQWKSRLLDLSVRNRLLNFKDNKSTIPILHSAPEQIEYELENELSLQPKPKMVGAGDPRNANIYTEKQKSDWLREFLKGEVAQRRMRTDP